MSYVKRYGYSLKEKTGISNIQQGMSNYEVKGLEGHALS